MSDDFFDSNIVLYSLDTANPQKQDIASRLLASAVHNANVSISFQVVQEVLNGITRRVQPRVETHDLQRLMDTFLIPLWAVMPSRTLYERALAIQQRYRYAFYDSLIIAAAIEARCTRLLTEDLQHGQVIDSVRIENPFLGI